MQVEVPIGKIEANTPIDISNSQKQSGKTEVSTSRLENGAVDKAHKVENLGTFPKPFLKRKGYFNINDILSNKAG